MKRICQAVSEKEYHLGSDRSFHILIMRIALKCSAINWESKNGLKQKLQSESV